MFIQIKITFFKFFSSTAFAGYLFPAPECVINSKGHYSGKMLVPVSNVIRCRAGQRMKIVTSSNADMETDFCCCKWDETLSAAQTPQNERKYHHPL